MVLNNNKPDYIIKDVSINDLELDAMNPRQEMPSEELCESIKKEQKVKEPLITWYNNGKYWISDGWQRYQAGFQTGLTLFPCRVYTDHIKALKATKEASIVNPWTDFQKYKFCKIFYDACIEKGMTHKEAIQKTLKELPYKKKILLRYLSIFELPLPVQSLMKEERNLTEKEIRELQKYDSMIKLRHKKLGIKIAQAIRLKLKGFPDNKICEIAVDILGMKNKDALRAIDKISLNPNTEPYEIIKKIETGFETKRILHVGDFIVDPDLKQTIIEYVSSRGIPTKIFIMELIKKWLLSTDKYYNLINPPKKGEMRRIKDISFKIRNYSISVFQVSGTPIIRIEGTPSTHFSYKEIKKKAWNQYMSFPQYLKDFLNTLKIEFEDKKEKNEMIQNDIECNNIKEYLEKRYENLKDENKKLQKELDKKKPINNKREKVNKEQLKNVLYN